MLTNEQINFLNKVCPNKWTEENNIVNINGNGSIIITSKFNLTEIPVQFGQVNHSFICSDNKLTTLIGCPFIIGGGFNCAFNQLTSLDAGPKNIDSYYTCSNNKLTNLIGAPKICNLNFNCDPNQLTSLEGCPQSINGYLFCNNNPLLKYLWGIGRVERGVYYDNRNEINEWIITCACKDIIFPHFTLEENINWITREKKYSCLLDAPEEIRKYFSPRILRLVDSGVYIF